MVRRVVARTERAGERAINWSINDIGGPDTLKTVWLKLKSDERLRGLKRRNSTDSLDSGENGKSPKRCKKSLNLSDTCAQLSEIFLDMSQVEDVLEARRCSGAERVLSNSSDDGARASDALISECGRIEQFLEENFGEGSIQSPRPRNGARTPDLLGEKLGESSINGPRPTHASGGARTVNTLEEKFGEGSINGSQPTHASGGARTDNAEEGELEESVVDECNDGCVGGEAEEQRGDETNMVPQIQDQSAPSPGREVQHGASPAGGGQDAISVSLTECNVQNTDDGKLYL